jgi:hypothetical protein
MPGLSFLKPSSFSTAPIASLRKGPRGSLPPLGQAQSLLPPNPTDQLLQGLALPWLKDGFTLAVALTLERITPDLGSTLLH